MARMKDLTGQRFGRLVVSKYSHSNKAGRAVWLCRCDCGSEIEVVGKALLSGNTSSCGCLRKEALKTTNHFRDLTGCKFGMLTVLYQVESNEQGSRWCCVCECGNKIEAAGKQLRSGQRTNCGVHRYEKLSELFREDLTGQRFGHVVAVSLGSKRKETKTKWIYQCDCGRYGEATSTNLKSGKVRSCGKCLPRSYGEEIIRDCLKKYKIRFDEQKRFIGCNNIMSLPFDFYLPDHNLAIEYDGEMHYKSTTLRNDLIGQQQRDSIKTNYCNENDIILLRIPYWERDNIESILLDWLFINDNENANFSDICLSS